MTQMSQMSTARLKHQTARSDTEMQILLLQFLYIFNGVQNSLKATDQVADILCFY